MNRKYTRIGEKASKYECTNRKCKWQGTIEEQSKKSISEYQEEHICPKCGNNQFYGLIKQS